jgi:hypothetical protein
MTHNKLIVQAAKLGSETGKIQADMISNFERMHQRRQKQNNSLLIPYDKTGRLSSFNGTSNHRVSLRSIASPNDFSNELGDNFVPPRKGHSLAP